MSKRIFQHPQETGNGPTYWRSVGQLAQTPEFKAWQDREFQTGAAELNPEVGRRGFMKYMAASAALAGLSMSACRREEKLLVPFVQGVEWSVPGKAIFYATSRPQRRGAHPLVIATYDGRPTKVEGNPRHAASKGATDIQSQASLLDLYDPDRSRRFQHDGVESNEAEFTKWLGDVMQKAGDGAGIGFLSEHFNSPTYSRLKAAVLAKLPKAVWATYEPLGGEEARTAQTASFGEGLRSVPQLDKADVILSLDCDFLGFDEGRLEGIRAFADRRKPEQKMNRLYVVENRYTTTGGSADHRLRVQASKVGAVTLALAEKVAAATGDASLKEVIAQFPKVATPAGAKTPQWIEEAAADLAANKGKALVLVGYRQPAAVQALAHAINAALGSFGKTVVGRKTGTSHTKATITDLAKAIEGKQVKTLFVLGGNPAYNAPADLQWAKITAGIEVVRHGYYEDETTYAIEADKDNKVTARHFVKWHVPAAHYLEAWGDGTASDGSYVSQQPMILPLFGGWSETQLLGVILTGKKNDGLELVQDTFKVIAGGISAESWAKFLHDGSLANSAPDAETLAFNAATAATLVATHKTSEGMEVVFIPCAKVDDGRFSNNAWLQELPDMITKVTWDNAAIISPDTAKKLGLHAEKENAQFKFDNGSWISIEVNGAKLEIPVYIAPGHADDSISITLGYGHSHEGRVGGREGNYMSHGGWGAVKSPVGFNAYPIRTSSTLYFANGATVKVLDRKQHLLGVTQEHGALEGRGADVIREGTTEDFAKNKGFAKDHEWLEEHRAMDAEAEAHDKTGHPVSRSAYSHPPLNDQNHQWGMAIDLTTCTGCSACMIACQSENNIPVVGKEQVIEGREMHWIRMDRYFVSDMNSRAANKDDQLDIAEPRMVMQPMPCQHCENAPCETVCPVNATVHSEDGINVMAYNRCIGTRYCANNCPFKVRRFNFFDFNERQKDKYFRQNLINEKGMADTLKMSKNPNVTVRMRGVMEKCTFCIQRVQEAKITAKVKAKDTDQVQVPTDSFQVACQQVCPSNAITFGNIKDPNSEVSKAKDNPRDYRLFDYVGVAARVSYLARVMNPNHKMPDVPKDWVATKHEGGKA